MVRKIDVKAGTLLGTRAVQRGGNWNNGAQAGVFSMNLNNAPSNSNTNIGFRCPPNFQVRTRSSSPWMLGQSRSVEGELRYWPAQPTKNAEAKIFQSG
jgi:hypothetical protein